MNPPATTAPETRQETRSRGNDALRLQGRLVRGGLGALLFLCGLCAWLFKLKGDGSATGGLLPYSPLQVLLPLLGLGAAVWLLSISGGRFPRLVIPQFSAVWFRAGIVLIVLGASIHLRGEGAKDAALFIVRWLLPAAFLAFFYLTRSYGVSPLTLVAGLASGAVLSALSVEAYRTLGLDLPVSAAMANRYSGYLNHPNQYGILCSTTSPIILFCYYSRRRFLKLGTLVLVPVYLLCLFQNLSKTNIVLFFVSLLVGSVVLSLKNPRRMLATVALSAGLAVVVAGTVGLAFDSIRETSPKAAKVLEDAFFNPTEASTVDSREVIWEAAFREIAAHPLTGLGPGQSVDALGIEHAHNMLLQIYLDAGLLGFGGLLLVILGVFWRAAELLREEFHARSEMDDERLLRLLSGLAMIIYVCANAMSDCFSTATMPAFIFFAAIAFAAEPETPSIPEGPYPRSRRRRPAPAAITRPPE